MTGIAQEYRQSGGSGQWGPGCGVRRGPIRLMMGPEGETGAVAFGWQPPYPSAGPIVRRLMWADSVADALAGQAYAVLEMGDRIELVGLLESLSQRLSR